MVILSEDVDDDASSNDAPKSTPCNSSDPEQ